MSADPKQEVMETRLSWEGDIAVLTIDNVARRNALSNPVRDQMREHLGALIGNKKCRAIVLTGAGGYFCAGGDIKGMKERGAAGQDFMSRRMHLGVYHDLIRVLVDGPKPVVTAVEGAAFGAGLSLAIASDFTVASHNARFGGAQILRGLCPDAGLYYLLAARSGPGRARELLLSGREFNAEQAVKFGVAHEMVDAGKTLEAALQAAERFAAVPPLAFALTKAAMTHSYHTLEACFRAEQDYQPVVGLSQDHKESVAAFLEKRKPVYTGE